MARNLENSLAANDGSERTDFPGIHAQSAQQEQGTGVTTPGTESQGNAFLAAANDCAVTDQQTVLRLPVLQNDQGGQTQDLEILAVSQPASGQAEIAQDGTITFAPDQPGHQEIRYVVQDANGETSDAKAHVFVNPEGGVLAEPVLANAGPIELAGVARTCVDGMALDIARLDGGQVVVDPPEPGQRVQVTAVAGQQIVVQDSSFIQAKFLNVDGGLLMISGDGRMIFLEGFVAASADPTPVTLSIDGSLPVAGERLLAQALNADEVGSSVQIAEVALSDEALLLQPAAGGEAHGGGAGFSPYDAGSIGEGPDAIGPQAPTALAFSAPEILLDSPLDSQLSPAGDDINAAEPVIPEDPDDPVDPVDPGEPTNQPPAVSINASISVEIGEVTSSTTNFVNAPALPDLVEARDVAASRINGVDGRNLVIGDGGDAAIIFRDEIALFQNSVGVYLIGENGEMLDPKIVFLAVEHANPIIDENGNQSHAFIRPGGGPLSKGD
ncbi:MAG: cadherin-like domain-containing protein, partial [Pseudomonadota bacterium]